MNDEAKFAKAMKRLKKQSRRLAASCYADHISIEMSGMFDKNPGALIRAVLPDAPRDYPMKASTKAKGRRYRKLTKYYMRAHGVKL